MSVDTVEVQFFFHQSAIIGVIDYWGYVFMANPPLGLLPPDYWGEGKDI